MSKDHIWLPENEIWARIPEIKGDKDEKAESTDIATNIKRSIRDANREELLCAICLENITADLKSLAVPCMHSYCKPCLNQWLGYRKSCPLCKLRITSLVHDIKSDTEYAEQHITASPARYEVDASTRNGEESDEFLARLEHILGVEFGIRVNRTSHNRSSSSRPRTADNNNDTPSLGFRTESGTFYPGSIDDPTLNLPRHQRTRETQARSSQEGPRPYYYRIQHHVASSNNAQQDHSHRLLHPVVTSTLNNTAANTRSSTDEAGALRWRRRVYEQRLYAQPLEDADRLAAPASSTARERRLQDWIGRELTALLPHTDNSIIASFVLGLLPQQQHSINNNGGRQQRAAAPNESVEVTYAREKARAVWSLQPFLHRNAEQFWHELTQFASSPYSLVTYDRLVQYAPHRLQLTDDSHRRNRSRSRSRCSTRSKRRRRRSPSSEDHTAEERAAGRWRRS